MRNGQERTLRLHFSSFLARSESFAWILDVIKSHKNFTETSNLSRELRREVDLKCVDAFGWTAQ